MKSVFSILALAALLFATSVNAQVEALYAGGTESVIAATNRTTTKTINISKQDYVAFTISFKCNDTNAYPVFFTLQPSADGANFDSTQTKVLSVTANGTSVVTMVTNLDCRGLWGYKLSSINNTNPTTYLTNLTMNYLVKRPGIK